jgi:hypothetical protein
MERETMSFQKKALAINAARDACRDKFWEEVGGIEGLIKLRTAIRKPMLKYMLDKTTVRAVERIPPCGRQ